MDNKTDNCISFDFLVLVCVWLCLENPYLEGSAGGEKAFLGITIIHWLQFQA